MSLRHVRDLVLVYISIDTLHTIEACKGFFVIVVVGGVHIISNLLTQ